MNQTELKEMISNDHNHWVNWMTNKPPVSRHLLKMAMQHLKDDLKIVHVLFNNGG